MAGVPENPYLPSGTTPLVVNTFNGSYTAGLRPGVPDEMCFWMDGFMPFAPFNARTMPGKGATLYTASGTTTVWFGFANIGSTPYMIQFLSNGQVVAVNTNNGSATTILSASTITALTINNTGMTQWGSQYVIIVADQANGYWVWDGTSVFKAGTLGPVVTLDDVGSGYSGAATASIVGGSGSGASLGVVRDSSTGYVTSISVVNPGSGYISTDAIVVSFSTPQGHNGGSIAGSMVASTIAGRFCIGAVSIVLPGQRFGTPTITYIQPDLLTSPTISLTVEGGSLVGISIVYGGVFNSSSVIGLGLTDAGTAASATAQLMPFGVQGTAVETYQGRVWVAKGPTIYFTAPGSFQDFATSDGGGNFTSSDSFLKVGFSQLVQTNGFLYLVGDSSVNYISGVQTLGVPPTTTFTNQNADPEVGSPYPKSVILQGQNVLFANAVGVYVLNGSRAVKVSDAIDPTWTSVPNFGGLNLCSAAATIFGKKVWMVLTRIQDPVSGATSNKMVIWDGKKWWASAQDLTNLTYIRHQEINSVITVYGTDGSVTAPLFTTASGSFQKTIQSKLFDTPGSLMTNKGVNRFWAACHYYNTVSTNLTITIDGIGISSSGQFSDGQNYTITGATSTGYFLTPPQAVGEQGVYSGLTIKTNAADMSLIGAMLSAIDVGYRG